MALIIKDRVKEVTTSTGSGALTLSGAMAGFKTFASRCTVGDTLYYALQAVDGSGAPTGDWETGLGTYSAANTLTRTTVLASSNADAAVNLAAGTKQVYITMPAAQVAWVRERLTAARTYYVRTDGADTNTGLSDTAGGAFLTIQKAMDVVYGTLDIGGMAVTIQVAAGTYTDGVLQSSPQVGSGTITLLGDATTPANVVISTTSANCVEVQSNAVLYLGGFKFQTTTSGSAVRAFRDGILHLNGKVDFGTLAASGSHIFSASGGKVVVSADYNVTGAAAVHLDAAEQGNISVGGRTVTFTGSLAYSTAFARCAKLSYLAAQGMTFSGGTITGTRYTVTENAVVRVDGGGASYFPGSVAGSTATGGLYL